MLINGQWVEKWQPVQASDDEGRFLRQDFGLRNRIGADSPEGFSAEAGRYVLYVAYICPWACRTLIALRLKGLEHAIEVRVVDPRLTGALSKARAYSLLKFRPLRHAFYKSDYKRRAVNCQQRLVVP